MNILHVITGLPKAAGTTTFVENVVREQRALGHTVDICTNATAKSLLPTSSFTRDIIHIHGLWSPLLHRAAHIAGRRRIPVVWSTHGMTAPWSLHHKWWKKCIPWHLCQKSELRFAALIHCTTDLEAEWNRQLGFEKVFVAPLGTSLPDPKPNAGGERRAIRTLLYVGRIYPVKALANAIRAVALMKHPVTLRLVGPDQAGHKDELMALCEQLHLPPSSEVQFVGPKYDAELSEEYDNCDGLILVSHTENFGATVVDAMAHAKPVITSTKTPWKCVADNRCGWWVDNDPATLARTFDAFAATSGTDLEEFGQRGLELVKKSYTWPSVARNLIAHYESVSHG